MSNLQTPREVAFENYAFSLCWTASSDPGAAMRAHQGHREWREIDLRLRRRC
jgi:hypothetical protein